MILTAKHLIRPSLTEISPQLWVWEHLAKMKSWEKARKESACAGRMCAKGTCDLRRIKGLLFSLCSLFLIIHQTFASFPVYLLYTEYQSLISLFFIGFVLLSSYLFVSRRVWFSHRPWSNLLCTTHFVENIGLVRAVHWVGLGSLGQARRGSCLAGPGQGSANPR